MEGENWEREREYTINNTQNNTLAENEWKMEKNQGIGN